MHRALTLIDILDNHTLYDRVLDFCSPCTIYRFRRSCRSANEAVQDYVRRAFNINRHLSRFFRDPLGFRRIQARTNAIVSGTNALELFDRRRFSSSELEVYVVGVKSTYELCHWLASNGYVLEQTKQHTFAPYEKQDASEFESHLVKLLRPHITADTIEENASHRRLTSALDDDDYNREVLTFCSVECPEGEEPLRVRITISWYAPIESVLSFHYTSAMNFYTYAAAYSLYPRATFESHLSLYCDTREQRYFPSFPRPERYTMRGWSIIPDKLHLIASEMKARMGGERMGFKTDLVPGLRRIGDEKTWVIPFADAEEVGRWALSRAQEPAIAQLFHRRRAIPPRDPITLNSFAACFSDMTGMFTMHFAAINDPRFMPQNIVHKDETCFVISQSLSPKLQVWRAQWSAAGNPRAQPDPDAPLLCLTELCMSKCSCSPFRHNDPNDAKVKTCPVSLQLSQIPRHRIIFPAQLDSFMSHSHH